MDIQKLLCDARAAKEAAVKKADAVEDSGTCNLDAAFIPLGKGQHSKPLVEALSAAGLGAYATRWLGRGVMINPPGMGQAYKREAANRVFIDTMIDRGWTVYGYYQMD